jgi:hypothetical protein
MMPTLTAVSATQSSLEELQVDDGAPQYLYIQMEHCEKKTLRDLILAGLSRDSVCVSTPNTPRTDTRRVM